jgi:hypothetical protein
MYINIINACMGAWPYTHGNSGAHLPVHVLTDSACTCTAMREENIRKATVTLQSAARSVATHVCVGTCLHITCACVCAHVCVCLSICVCVCIMHVRACE